jgi:uncharacterized DUF497 family protein
MILMSLNFSWDDKKNTINKKKHKISFEEAETAFYDERAKIIPDPDHSLEEERFILLGMNFKLKLLVETATNCEYPLREWTIWEAVHSLAPSRLNCGC